MDAFDGSKDSAAGDLLIQRMARAKWITGNNVVTNEGVHLEYTSLGSERMRHAGELLKECAPELLDLPPLDLTEFDKKLRYLKHMERIAKTALALEPPPFTSDEWDTFVMWVVSQAKRDSESD
jgi:hypothetical protein